MYNVADLGWLYIYTMQMSFDQLQILLCWFLSYWPKSGLVHSLQDNKNLSICLSQCGCTKG